MPDRWVPRLCWLGVALSLAAPLLIVAGCAAPRVASPIPAWLVPARPVLPVISAAELSCLSDDAYVRLATRERLRALEIAQLRALVEGGK